MNKVASIFALPLKWLMKGGIWFYKLALSPYLGKHCCYSPTCSTYALQALEEFGVVKGALLAVKRIVRCNPKSCGGFDPVPINLKGDRKWII